MSRVMVTVCLPSAPALVAVAVALTLESDFSSLPAPASTFQAKTTPQNVRPVMRLPYSWDRIISFLLVRGFMFHCRRIRHLVNPTRIGLCRSSPLIDDCNDFSEAIGFSQKNGLNA